MRIRHAVVLVAALATAACFGGPEVAEIHLAADGTLTLNGEPTTLEALANAEALEGDDPLVRVSAEGDVAYRHVAALMGALRSIDLENVTFDVTDRVAR